MCVTVNATVCPARALHRPHLRRATLRPAWPPAYLTSWGNSRAGDPPSNPSVWPAAWHSASLCPAGRGKQADLKIVISTS